MSTKLVSEWNKSLKDLEGLKLTKYDVSDRIVMNKNKDVELFLSEEHDFLKGRDICNLLNFTYLEASKQLNSKRWICLIDEMFFDKKAGGCWVLESLNEDGLYKSFPTGTKLSKVTNHVNKILKDPLNQWEVPNNTQLRCITNLSKDSCPPTLTLSSGRISIWTYALYRCEDEVIGFDCDKGCLKDSTEGSCIPFLSFSAQTDNPREIFVELLKRGLTPIALEDSKEYKMLLSIFQFKFEEVYTSQDSSSEKLLQQQHESDVIEYLLNEDKVRADIAPYHKKILHDIEQGHWSLWPVAENTNENEVISLSDELVARDPKSSINDGVVAIDFGTKSTVVVYQKGNVNIHPMRVGTGDLSTDIEAFHYENPTIMEFRNLDAFISAYKTSENKPYTRWQDITISHTAKNAMEGTESSQFNTFLDEIKQWAGDKSRKLKVVGQNGKVIDLPPFLELTDDDFNPVEIYAYYLGLYINNLNNGIFMEYILSFPVTYEVPIRNKLIESFDKGLKKSLPSELGKDAIANLNVTKGASEPAAYALTAFKSYEFAPEGDKRIFYSVFDFGGGTTDFDFGLFREAKKGKERRFDYVIEHFGAGGDQFLGGENLLELLAFEVFKKNKSALLKAGIQFEKHPEKDAFAGSEQLLSNSQEARNNTKKMCIALRPFWEEYEGFLIDDSGEMTITLTDIEGIQHSAFALDIDEEELKTILSERIERGVENFFNALRLAFSNSRVSLNDIDEVQIFLAGNSSQSTFVHSLFEKHIALQDDAIDNTNHKSNFKLFPPLGSDKNDVEKPTGKTGVAFGLIESREGGNIMVIDHNVREEDIRFKYYLGENRKSKFKPVVDREVSFNQWVDFIDAGYQKFELFYTDQPSASTGTVDISDNSIKKKSIKLDMTDDEALVYIRVVSPTKIEFVVANEGDINNKVYLNNIQYLEL